MGAYTVASTTMVKKNTAVAYNGYNVYGRAQGQNFATDAEREAAQQAFLVWYAECGVILSACKYAKITYMTYKSWLEEAWFAEACQFAIEEHREKIYQEVDRRGRDGILEPLVQSGKVVTHNERPVYVRKYSDRLLLAQLQRFFPLPQSSGALGFTTGGPGEETYVHLPWDTMTEEEQQMIELIGRNLDARKGALNGTANGRTDSAGDTGELTG